MPWFRWLTTKPRGQPSWERGHHCTRTRPDSTRPRARPTFLASRFSMLSFHFYQFSRRTLHRTMRTSCYVDIMNDGRSQITRVKRYFVIAITYTIKNVFKRTASIVLLSMTNMPSTLTPIGTPVKRFRNTFICHADISKHAESAKTSESSAEVIKTTSNTPGLNIKIICSQDLCKV